MTSKKKRKKKDSASQHNPEFCPKHQKHAHVLLNSSSLRPSLGQSHSSSQQTVTLRRNAKSFKIINGSAGTGEIHGLVKLNGWSETSEKQHTGRYLTDAAVTNSTMRCTWRSIHVASCAIANGEVLALDVQHANTGLLERIVVLTVGKPSYGNRRGKEHVMGRK